MFLCSSPGRDAIVSLKALDNIGNEQWRVADNIKLCEKQPSLSNVVFEKALALNQTNKIL